jgi:hypothetical protein
MSELRSVVDALRSETLPELPDARIEEDFAELQRAVELLEVERLRRLAEIDRRRIFERDGHLSAAAWLATTFKLTWGSARQNVRVARALEEMPKTRGALHEGDISMSGVRLLVMAREADPAAFARDEAQLVEAARIHSMNDLHGLLRIGDKPSNANTRWRAMTSSESGAGSTHPSHSSAWCASMATSIRRRERPCSRRSEPCSTPSRARARRTTSGARHSAGPTPSARSAVSGWTWPSAQPWQASAHT